MTITLMGECNFRSEMIRNRIEWCPKYLQSDSMRTSALWDNSAARWWKIRTRAVSVRSTTYSYSSNDDGYDHRRHDCCRRNCDHMDFDSCIRLDWELKRMCGNEYLPPLLRLVVKDLPECSWDVIGSVKWIIGYYKVKIHMKKKNLTRKCRDRQPPASTRNHCLFWKMNICWIFFIYDSSTGLYCN